MTASPTKLALLKKAENELLDDAIRYATGDIADAEARKRHLALADEYARARWATVTGSGGTKPRPATSNMKLPIGRSAGALLSAAKADDLKWVAARLEESIDNPDKQRWRADNVSMLNAITAELAWRGES